MRIRPVVGRIVPGGQTDRQRDMLKLVALCNFANAPKNYKPLNMSSSGYNRVGCQWSTSGIRSAVAWVAPELHFTDGVGKNPPPSF